MKPERTATRRILTVGMAGSLLVALLVSAQPQHAAADPERCVDGATLNIVAHQDDDLLFQGSAIGADIAAGKCVRTVYVTAGDDNMPEWYWRAREDGVRAAYAHLAGLDNDWTRTELRLSGHTVDLVTLRGAPSISLVFMHLPDGQMDGRGNRNVGLDSLQKLLQGQISTIHTVDGSPAYTKPDLVTTLVTLMQDFGPSRINTLDYHGTYGEGDHSDHYAVAALTAEAQAQYTAAHAFVGYEGYGIAARPPNLTSGQEAAKSAAFFVYGSHDYKTCDSASSCAYRAESAWLSREYTVADTPPTDPPPDLPIDGSHLNIASAASISASSENPGDSQYAANVADGHIDGYPGDYTREWATRNGGAGSWLNLAWTAPVTLDKIVLFDRPNLDDHITAGTITFTDGTQLAIPTLNNDGSATTLTFPEITTTTIRLTITGVGGTTRNVGLAEFEAWTPTDGTEPPSATPTTTPSATPTAPPTSTSPPPTTSPSTPPTPTTSPSTPPTTPTPTTPVPTTTPTPPSAPSVDLSSAASISASSENPGDSQYATNVADGHIDGYPGDYTREWATRNGGAGSWLNLAWTAPVTLDKIVLFDRPNLDDHITAGTITFTDGTQLAIPTLNNDGSATTLTFPEITTTTIRLTITAVGESTRNIGLAELQVWGVAP